MGYSMDHTVIKKVKRNFEFLFQELDRLALPPLNGKEFLEIGCGEGFFSGFAWFEGAASVLGLDSSEDKLEIARSMFPFCTFRRWTGNFAKIISEKAGFDIILCTELLSYDNLRSLLPVLMHKLKRDGTLVAKFVKNEIETFPWHYIYRDMGACDEAKDSVHIYHVSHRAPYAILLMGESGSGKTTAAKHLFSGIHVIHGDSLMRDLAGIQPGSLKESYPYLNDICFGDKDRMSVGGIMIQIFNSAAGKQYACIVAELAAGKDFVYEGVIHKNFQHIFVKQLEILGYKVLMLDTQLPENSPNFLFRHAKDESRKYCLYLNALE